MSVLIRPGAIEDLPEIARLHSQCFPDAWDGEFIGRILAQPGAFAVVALKDSHPAGFILARANAGEAEILSLGVAAAWREQLVATQLVRNALQRASDAGAVEAFLEVAVDNAAARALYGRLGFREAGLRHGYYVRTKEAAADALILRRTLPL